MITIACLFGSEADASAAIDELYTAGLDDLSTEVVKAIPDTWLAIPPTSFTAGLELAGFTTPATDYDLALDLDLEEDEATFFIRGIREGGVVVIIEVDDDDADLAEEILVEHNGQFIEAEEA